MKHKFYPLLKDFLKLKNTKLFETSAGFSRQSSQNKDIYKKLEDLNEVVSPFTGETINMKKVMYDVEQAKFLIGTQSPLFRPFIHDMTPTVYTWLVGTMATDGVRLFINPEFANKLSWLGKIFVLLHEIMHCVLIHMERSKGKNMAVFNVAADYEINSLLVDTDDSFDEAFVKNDVKGLYDVNFLNTPVEEIYDYLIKNPHKMPKEAESKEPKKPKKPTEVFNPIEVGEKVRIKKTKQKGIVTRINSDGTYEINIINESLFFPMFQLLEGYTREELIPIRKPGINPPTGGQESEHYENVEIDGPDNKEKHKKTAKQIKKSVEDSIGAGKGDSMNPDDSNDLDIDDKQRELISRLKDADLGGTGGIIPTYLGEEIARMSGYDEEEMRAGEEGRQKWAENAQEMIRGLKKQIGSGTGRGNNLLGRIKSILKPAVDWKAILKLFVGRALSEEKHYRIGAKKHLYKSDEYLRRGLKVKRDAINNVVVCVDVSGSMFGGNTIDRVLSEVNNIIFQNKIKEIHIIFFDDGVDPGSNLIIRMGQRVLKPVNLEKIRCGGGTNFQKPFDWIHNELNDNIQLCIFLTDGEASNPKTPPYHRNVIWVVYDNETWNAPFGKQIIVDSNKM